MPRRKEKTVVRNGIEYYYKSIRDERGKYITVYGRTIAERDEKVKKREAEIRLRRKIKEFPTFSERATEWLSDKSADLKRNTYNNYEQIIRTHFIPVLGDKRLIDITGEDIKKAMAVAEAQSASVYRKASMLIKQIFADALTCDLIQGDPTTKYTFKRVRREKEDTGILDGRAGCHATCRDQRNLSSGNVCQIGALCRTAARGVSGTPMGLR
mgnify:CR=1 FL=1